MAVKKLKWTDVEDIAFRMIDEHPDMNPLGLRFTDLHKFITKLPDFGDDPKKSNEKILEAIQMTWLEERQEMEDELGPLPEVADDEELDEDDYRDDKMIDEKEADVLDPKEEEEEEDEFSEGFQEEGDLEEKDR